MSEQLVRVIRTWDVPVEAEYGDTEASLLAKATVSNADATEVRVLLPQSDVPLTGECDHAIEPTSTPEK